MESASLGLTGLVLDSSVLIAAERRKLTAAQAIETVQRSVGEVPVVLSAVTIAEIGNGGNHGPHRGRTSPKGRNLPLGDLMIGACALEFGYAISAGNARDFNRIPGLQLISL
jgi:predicted nucleic acid-binding protein